MSFEAPLPSRLPRPEPRPGAGGGLSFNARELVVMTVAGQVGNALVRTPYRLGRDGVPRVLPGTGGVVLNVHVGDRAVGIAGDHVEPGASIRNVDKDGAAGRAANRGLLFYSCIGNHALVTSGPARGAQGTVIGKHGGIDNVIVHFEPRVLARLRPGDRIQIRAVGQGMRLLSHPGVRLLNLSPRLLRRWGIQSTPRRLLVPVTHVLPAGLLGSGLGKTQGVLGDTDIQLGDGRTRRLYRLDGLRLGDLVAVSPLDYRFGSSHRSGFLTIGVIVHTDSTLAGHGPGFTPLLVSTRAEVLPLHDGGANIATLLRLRTSIAPPVAMDRPVERAAWKRAVAAASRPRQPVTTGGLTRV